ncbi:MAG: RNA polymerase sigma factor [Bacteroidia bacterium]|nr:RNA polymerase sigma factor [Bacteroidia bacterium]
MTSITQKLIKACRKKDKKAQSKLYELCYGILMPIAMRYATCQDDAMAYLNLGFYKILKNLDKLKDIQAFPAWARKVLIHSILDELKKEKRYNEKIVLGDENGKEELPDDFLQEAHISAEDIYHAIRSLPPVTASVFNLYAIDGYKQKEIAEMLGVQIGTVKWHYAEARKRLKEKLSHYCDAKASEKKRNLIRENGRG